MRRPVLKLMLAGFLGAIVGAPIAVYAAATFTDVPESDIFSSDIEWLANADVTRGCNPPANTLFCPDEPVSRRQMAAFLHRLAVNQVVDAGTLNGKTSLELGEVYNELYEFRDRVSDVPLGPGEDVLVAAGCAVEFGEVVAAGGLPSPNPDVVLVGSYPDDDILDPVPANYWVANTYWQRKGWTVVWRNIGSSEIVGDFEVVAKCLNGGEQLMIDLGY